MRFRRSVQTSRPGPRGETPLQRRGEPLLMEGAANAGDGGEAHFHGDTDRFVRPGGALGSFIGFEEHAHMIQAAGGSRPTVDLVFQILTLLERQEHAILLRARHRFTSTPSESQQSPTSPK